jgi:hypothetical protein
MTPDYETAALRAAETLITYGISAAPVSPLPILKKLPGVFVVSFQTMSDDIDIPRKCVIDQFGAYSQDAFTSVNIINGKPQYLVTYNQLLPSFIVSRALARELGHIVLGHDGSRPEDVRQDEARCFANHLLAPRALLHFIQSTNLRLTVEVLGNLTGCYDYCLSCMRRLPATHVPAELNRQIRDNFMPYMFNFFYYQRVARHSDGSALADLGTYMDGYEE